MEGLVTNAGPVRARFNDVRSELTDELLAALHPVAFMEYRFPDFQRAQRNLARRAEQRRLASAAEGLVKRSEDEAAKAEQLKTELADQASRLEQVHKEIASLKAALAQKEQEASSLTESISKLTADSAQQQRTVAETVQAAEDALNASSMDIGGDEEDDLLTMADLESIIHRAVAAVQDFLNRAAVVDHV